MKSIDFHVDTVGVIGMDDSINAFTNTIDYLINIGKKCKVILVLPLETLSSELSCLIPQTQSDVEKAMSAESPSLYITAEDIFSYKEPIEEYKHPLNFSLCEIYSENVLEYYREYRSILELNNSWEYSRAIYLEYFTDRFLNHPINV
ncbi:hypothetical protein [Deinococcus sp.]|uniref:hypothetical protein n=1 Tax=Deinococcus sp. TaxID=47478 RepID=UPI003CC605C4